MNPTRPNPISILLRMKSSVFVIEIIVKRIAFVLVTNITVKIIIFITQGLPQKEGFRGVVLSGDSMGEDWER